MKIRHKEIWKKVKVQRFPHATGLTECGLWQSGERYWNRVNCEKCLERKQ